LGDALVNLLEGLIQARKHCVSGHHVHKHSRNACRSGIRAEGVISDPNLSRESWRVLQERGI
jgi:hypothetical protein